MSELLRSTMSLYRITASENLKPED